MFRKALGVQQKYIVTFFNKQKDEITLKLLRRQMKIKLGLSRHRGATRLSVFDELDCTKIATMALSSAHIDTTPSAHAQCRQYVKTEGQ